MENENIAQSPQPVVSPPAPSAPKVSQSSTQQMYEYAMLGFGIITVYSLIVRNGFLLKIGITLFLIVAIISITQSIARSRAPSNKITSASEAAAKKPTSPWKVLGIILLVILLIPVIGQMLLVGLFILMLVLGGGNVGT